jgi:hypothetical protein
MSNIQQSAIRFPLGQTVITQGALGALTTQDIVTGIRRHSSCDWGDVCPEDAQLNDAALSDGTRLLSAYKSLDGIRFWVITEADRSVTTFLLPSEY